MKHVVVVGGGVIGLASAYYLKKLGMDVTIIEKDQFGMACSKGNQGWVCPALHEPIPAPGLVSESFQMLLKKDSPLYIKPSAVPRLSSWLTQFTKYCNEEAFKKGEKALLTLSKSTLSLFDSFEADGIEFELYRKGMLFAFLDETKLQHKLERFKEVAKLYGHASPVHLHAKEIHDMEPTLSKNVIGGIYLDQQYHIRPESLLKGLVKKLEEMGANLYANTEVVDLERKGQHVVAVKTAKESFEADNVVLAMGAWSEKLTKKLHYKLPLTAGKGYSMTISNPNHQLEHPLYLGDTKGGITPFNNAVRIGGTMELSGTNLNFDKKRMQRIRSSAALYLKGEIGGDQEEEWVGMRPMTPDGLPVIGKVPEMENAYIATGHAMVGMSMAPATGKIMSDLISRDNTEFDISAFKPSRF